MVRIKQLIALIDAGVINVSLGPNVKVEYDKNCEKFELKTIFSKKIKVDFLFEGKILTTTLNHSKNPLIKSLFENRICSQFKIGMNDYGGIKIDENFNLVDTYGKTISSLFCLGVPTEGSKYFTYILPRPYVNSTALSDANKAVKRMFSAVLQTTEI